ncbi:uncharacterized protein LOC143888805 [Tasmannia lanceolata]|uniref:uncharacterized protein LOC143888805 n=1 Tax=Tasmannia lanceolata TaxID=3420 RepID=UPI0040644A34
MAARKLRPYFQAHTVKVLTDQPLRQVLHRPDISGRLVKWAVELSEFDIQYAPRPAIKAQVLADFVAKCTIPQQVVDPEAAQLPVTEKAAPEECIAGEPQEIMRQPTKPDTMTNAPVWEVYVDGSSNKSGCGAGLVLTGPDEFTADYALRFGFRVYEARDERMVKYLAKVHQLSGRFASFEVIRVPRTENTKADVLSKLAASGYTTLGRIRMEFLQRSSIEREAAEIMQVENEPCWMDEIIHYLRDEKLPEDKKEARKCKTCPESLEMFEVVLLGSSFGWLAAACLQLSSEAGS